MSGKEREVSSVQGLSSSIGVDNGSCPRLLMCSQVVGAILFFVVRASGVLVEGKLVSEAAPPSALAHL